MGKITGRQWTIGLFITAWAVVSIAVTSVIHSYHLVSFFPQKDLAITTQQKWSLTHVLSTDCKCSKIVAQYLLKRGPSPFIAENIILMGEDKTLASQLQSRGFGLRAEDPNGRIENEALGVPYLIVATPSQSVVYAGGYANEKLQPETPIQDLEILESLKGGRSPSSFPIFGCAASLKYQKKLDPFGIKYKKEANNDHPSAL